MQEKMINIPEEQVFSKDNPFRMRSFVRRNGRRTEAQDQARDAMWDDFGLQLEKHELDLEASFGRNAPCVLEIGFGSGQSLLAAAKQNPELNFIGIEAHKPGIGALLLGMQESGVDNIRVFDADAFEVLKQMMPTQRLHAVSIFFPDPWQKRRHHKRRLIQPSFLDLLVTKLQPEAELHIATDWQHYADHIMETMSADKRFVNLAGEGKLSARSPYRPIVTKFEGRALREGRKISDFRFEFAAI